MRPFVALTPIVAGLVLGCTGPCWRSPHRSEEEGYVGWDALAAAVDADGRLTADGCAALCTPQAGDIFVDEVHGCRFADADPDLSWLDHVGDTADTAAEPEPPVVLCDVTGKRVCEGRHHASIAARSRSRAADPLGRHLADAALSEATSIRAFRELARELRDHGAPSVLVDGCLRAARDEASHAATMGRLARARGARMPRARTRPTPARDLLALAIENAVEGCVHETFAAALAAHQSVHADPRLRPTYRRIATDELRHAELAWAIDAWAASRLDADGRAAVEAARADAVASLEGRIAAPDPAVTAVVGLPGVAAQRRLVAGLADALWSAAPDQRRSEIG